jgi:hypothetical protein
MEPSTTTAATTTAATAASDDGTPLVQAALRALPLLVQLGDYIGNGPVDSSNPQSLGERCDVVEALRAALGALGVSESDMAPTKGRRA